MAQFNIDAVRPGKQNHNLMYAQSKSGNVYVWHREMSLGAMVDYHKRLQAATSPIKATVKSGNWRKVR